MHGVVGTAVPSHRASVQEDRVLDTRKDLAELMGNQDQRGVLFGDFFKVVEQLSLGQQIQTGCRFIEYQGLGSPSDGSGQEGSAALAGGHGSEGTFGQRSDPHEFHRLVSGGSHRFGDEFWVGLEFAGKESGQDSLFGRESAGSACVKMLVDLSADEPQSGPEVPDVPFGLAEDADGPGLVAFENGRIQVSGQEFEQSRFARAVGSEDGRVLSEGDRQG